MLTKNEIKHLLGLSDPGEIEKNEFNLNIPHYIDSSEAEDLQDIEAHLLGDIPKADVEALQSGFHPKEIIHAVSEALLTAYTDKPLINRYAVYQHLMNYWSRIMQDDCYLIAADDWQATTYRIIETNKKGKEVDKGWTCDLIPKALIISRTETGQ